MARKLVVTVDSCVLTDAHRAAISAAAAANGFSAEFYDNDAAGLAAASDAEVLFGSSAMLAAAASHLKWMCTPSAGVGHLTAPGTFASHEAVLSNSSGAYGVTIAEHILLVILTMLRRQPAYNEIVSRRAWTRDLAVRSIKNSRVTLLGTGDIGRTAAARLRAFEPACLIGMNRSGHPAGDNFDRIITEKNLDSVLKETDILIMALPGTAQTAHILSKDRLAALPDSALIVNVGRGSAIDRTALEQELRAGRLMAALDVFEQEPLPEDDSLWTCPGLLITPHVAGNMTLAYTADRIVQLFLEDFENYCAGRPILRQVDRQLGY